MADDVSEQALEAVELARSTGGLSRGTNETTKAIERGNAELVVVAKDVDPPEIVMHLAPLCEEKGVVYAEVPSKEELGRASGIEVQCASIAVTKAGEAKQIIDELKKGASSKEASEEDSSEDEAAAASEEEEENADEEEAPEEESDDAETDEAEETEEDEE